jgi:putative tricarboxylic transport membrane protein
LRALLPNADERRDSVGAIARGTVIGFLVGLLPGAGATLSSYVAYAIEKKWSRHPERFGKGAIEGVAAPESANNAATSSGFIPLLTLGLPANVVMALMLGAFMLHGITPGPMLLLQKPDMLWGIVTSMVVGNVMLLVLNLPAVGLFVKITKLPRTLMAPLILLACVVGAFGVNNNPMDILTMMIFGVLGYLAEKYGFNAAPLVLAFVIGPMMETSLRQSLILSHGDFAIFATRPISGVLIGVVVLTFSVSLVRQLWRLRPLVRAPRVSA